MADVPAEISEKEVAIEPPIQHTTADKDSDFQEKPTVSVETVAVEIDSTTVPDVSMTGDEDVKSKVGSDYESIESIMHFIMNPDDVAPDNTQNPCIPEEKEIDTAVLKIPAAEEMDIIPKETIDTEITSPANANEKNIVEKVINAEITSSEIAVNAEKNTTNSDDVIVEKETTSEAVKEKNDDNESGFGDASNSANILDPVTRESQNITDADDTSMDGIHDSELDGLLVEGSARYRGDSDQYDDEDNSDDHSAEGIEGLSYRGGLGDDSNQEYGDRASDIDDEDFVPTQDEEEDDDDDEEDDDDDEDDLGTGRRRYNKKTVRRPSYQGQRPPVKTDEDFADDENDDAISNLSVDNANETFGNIQMQVVPVTFDTEETIGGISSPTVENDESSTVMEDVLMEDVDSRQNGECSLDIQIVSVDGNIRVEAEVEPSVKTDEAIKLDICLEREEIESLSSTEIVTLQTPIREAIENIEESQVIAELDKDMELLNKRIADDVCSSACDTLLREKATIEDEEPRLKFPEIPLINPETLDTDVSMGEEKTSDNSNITIVKKLQINSSLKEPDGVGSTAEMPENVDASLPVKMYESRGVTDVEKKKVPECMEVDSGDKEVQDSESHSSSLKIISEINKATKAFEDCLLSSKTSILATADVKKHLDMEMVVDKTEKNLEKTSTSKDQLSPKSKIGDNKDNILAKTSRLSIAKEATKVTEDIVCLEESSSDSDAGTKGKEADKEIVKTEEENKSEPTKEMLSDLITATKSTPATDLAVSKTTTSVPAKVTEIFLLDSDDDDVIIPKVKKPEKKTHPRSTPVAKKLTAPRRSSSKKHSSTKSVIKDGEKSGSPMTPASVSGDNAEKSLMELCANPRCQSDPKGNIKLEQSPSVALSLHRATQSGKLCVACLQEAVGCAERLVCGLREGASLYKIALPNTEDLVEISSSDSETTEDQPKFLKQAAKRKRRTKSPKIDGDNQYSLTDDEMLLITCNIEKVMEEVCSKFSISKHIATYEESIRQDLLLLQKDAMEFELELSELQKKTDYTRNHFYDTFKPPTSSFPELLINSLIDERTGQDFHKQTIELADDEWTPDRLGYSAKKKLTTAPEVQDVAERRSTRVRKPVNYNVDTEEALQQAALVAGLRIPNAAECEAALPPEGPEERVLVPLKVGDVMYAVRHSIFSAWVLATIMEIWAKGTMLSNGTLALFTLMTVKFEAATRGEGFVIKQVTGRQVACLKPSAFRYTIGTRVIALFKDQTHQKKKDAYYSGVIAETPSPSNIFRYLVFFDDGYAQYVKHTDAIRVCEMSLRVYEDVHADSRDFIKKYLSTYPDRAMVRMQPGQEVKVEWSGKWWVSRVLAVDSSLALMRFEEGENTVVREEWIYRGSTRLLPLFLELQAADRRAQGRHRAPGATSNTNKMANYPYVEYTRLDEVTTAPPMATEDVSPIIPVAVPLPLPTPAHAPVTIPVAVPMVLPAPPPTSQGVQPTEPRAVAKKSTTHRKKDSKVEQPVTPALPQPQIPRRATPAGAMEPHSDQVRSKVVYYTPKVKVKPKKLAPHACSPNCLNKDALPLRILKTHNPLARPLLSGWERLIMKSRGKRTIMYRAPCGRRLRSPQELHLYLRLTASEMSVDLFDFDHWVHCLAEYVLTKCFVTKRDISHGVEAVPIQCVNDCDHTLPQFCAYSTRRIPTQGVDLNLDQEFLCGCDCTDDCQNKETCQCWQLTYEGARVVGYDPNRVGYQYKRLLEPVPTGIYECNSRCKCAMTCLNRVVQHPLQLKLQVFKTVNRGWGIKALNDIPRGCFLCIYAGNLLTDAVANVDGVNEGDEFLAELDYIEVVEKLKESYESDVPDEDKILDKKHESNTSDEDDDDDDDEENETENKRAKRDGPAGESDEEFTPSCFVPLDEAGTRRSTRQKKKKNKSKDKKMDIPVTVAEINKVIGIAEPMETDEPVKEMGQSETDRCIEELKEKIGVLNVANKEDSAVDKTVDNKTDNVENDQVKDDIKLPDSTIESKEKTTAEKVKDKIFDVDAEDEKKQKEDDEKTEKDKPIKKPGDDDMITISDDEEAMREPSRFTAPEGLNEDEYVPKYRSVRSLFGPDEACFIMDAKVQGNLGRYLNHSCTPNVFVQNVFVDTHDPRFPWVAFFALNHVRAGTELTWNYNYDVGSVPGKVLYCYCGAVTCRGRLL